MSPLHEAVKTRLLLHLRFPAIHDRKERIATAIKDTFEWIYSKQVPSAGHLPWNPFVHWLESNSGLYWIAGKAGCGKSTLMKFLHLDPRTEEHLRVWVRESRLLIAGHFFWNSGNSVQMSVEGLVRTLLYEVATQVPNMLPNLFPNRWSEMELSSDPKMMTLPLWTLDECLQAFRRILSRPFNGSSSSSSSMDWMSAQGTMRNLRLFLKKWQPPPMLRCAWRAVPGASSMMHSTAVQASCSSI